MNSNNCMVRAYNYNQIMNVTSSLVRINSFLIHILHFKILSEISVKAPTVRSESCLEIYCEVFFQSVSKSVIAFVFLTGLTNALNKPLLCKATETWCKGTANN